MKSQLSRKTWKELEKRMFRKSKPTAFVEPIRIEKHDGWVRVFDGNGTLVMGCSQETFDAILKYYDKN